ncbi:hypothetical protein NL480_30060, partial [Klebsiella pneumoniae]|nr:hypothetical protein [Klebsiella pneumoniae]
RPLLSTDATSNQKNHVSPCEFYQLSADHRTAIGVITFTIRRYGQKTRALACTSLDTEQVPSAFKTRQPVAYRAHTSC